MFDQELEQVYDQLERVTYERDRARLVINQMLMEIKALERGYYDQARIHEESHQPDLRLECDSKAQALAEIARGFYDQLEVHGA